MAWTLPLLEIEPPKHPEALTDVLPLLDRLDRAFGTRAIGRLLDVASGTVTNWKSGRHTISPVYATRIIDLHDVLMRALRVYPPQIAMDWLVGSNPFLDHARPIDVLVRDGAGPLIRALAAAEAAAYA